ncbi:MAG: SufD family Fe-S cluster assembly protein, partial [Candidatus Gracilibacteria bacterium]
FEIRDDVVLKERMLEIHVGAGAELHWQSFQSSVVKFSSNIKKRFILDSNAKLVLFEGGKGGSKFHEEIEVVLKGAGAECTTEMLFSADGVQESMVLFFAHHYGKNTKSIVRLKGALSGKSRGVFKGFIRAHSGSFGMQGSLEEHVLLLSEDCRLETIPGLEIQHSEVGVFHSAKIEHVDEEKLFYLQSRGLSTEQAIELIVQGFFEDSFRLLKSFKPKSFALSL